MNVSTAKTLLKILAVVSCLGVVASVVICLSIPLLANSFEQARAQFIVALIAFFFWAAAAVVSGDSLWIARH